jgi:hypothetical protein
MLPGGPVRQPYLSYRPAMLHRLAESIPWTITGLLKSLKILALAYAQMFNDDHHLTFLLVYLLYDADACLNIYSKYFCYKSCFILIELNNAYVLCAYCICIKKQLHFKTVTLKEDVKLYFNQTTWSYLDWFIYI